MPFDAASYVLAKRALKRAIQAELLPTLKDLVIDVDKDWGGHLIKNLGAPVDPNDAARKTYVDVAATGLGITLFLLDAADSEVPSYKSTSVEVPELSEAYVEASSNSAGDVEIAGWIAPSDFTVVKLGAITMQLQAEKISGNIDVRLFFRIYERTSGGTETLINESSLSDLVEERANFVISMVLPSDHVLAAGSRLVIKLYARYLSSGSSTTVRVYYQGDVRSRVTFPITKEVMDTLYLPYSGARYDVDLGSRYLNAGSLRVGGTEVVDSSRNLKNVTASRSIISDFFGSPFWDNIPDKPSVYPPDLHASSHALGGSDELSLDASQITSGTLSADRIPGLDASKIVSGRFPLDRLPDGSSGYVLEAQGSGSNPAWVNPNGRYTPASHTHVKADITDFAHDHSGDTLKPAAIDVGDINFANGWKLTEDPKHGLVLISPDGKKYAFELKLVG